MKTVHGKTMSEKYETTYSNTYTQRNIIEFFLVEPTFNLFFNT